MWPATAIEVALRLVAHPASAKHVSPSCLPNGVTELLAVAAGNADTLYLVQLKTGQSEEALRAAAGFFIEQVLFSPQADHYRILGTSISAPRSELRHHMILLMKWLHPDGHAQPKDRSAIDRTVFIHHVTRAWEDLKTDERRAVYDQTLNAEIRAARNDAWPPRLQNRPQKPGWGRPRLQALASSREKRRSAGLVMYRIEPTTLFSRLVLYLRSRQ